MAAERLEKNPRGAKTLADIPQRMSEWELNLRRCVQEGRTPPGDATKRFALLRMLPQKQREAIWPVANKLYPSFQDLLLKIQEMVQDEVDIKNGAGPMDIDELEAGDGEDDWENTGQT